MADTVQAYAPGPFAWVDLGTTDAAGATRFYTGLFGWTADDTPMGPDSVYTMLRRDGREVGALHVMDEAKRGQGVPPHWTPYFWVEDCDGAAARARGLGGTVKVSREDIPGVGRFAVIQDPQGAVFSVITLAGTAM